MVYAQINDENICMAVSNLSGEVSADNLIPLEVFDASILGKKWTGDGWEDVPQPEPEPEPEPTQLDKIEEQVYSNNDNSLIIMEAMADQYEQTEEYRLNDMEVQATIFESVLALSEGV